MSLSANEIQLIIIMWLFFHLIYGLQIDLFIIETI